MRHPALRRHLCDDAAKAARLAIANAERSAGELAAAEAAAAADSKPAEAARPGDDIIDLHGNPYSGVPRFPIGAMVECRLGEDKWMIGEVIGHNYREQAWPEHRRAPYQVADRRESPP